MADGTGKVVVNLTTGDEDADQVTVAFLVATAALEPGRPVSMFTTKEAVRLGLPGYAGLASVRIEKRSCDDVHRGRS